MKKSSIIRLLMLFFVIISVQLRAQDYKIYFEILDTDEIPESIHVENIDQNTDLILQGDDVLHLVNTLSANNNVQSFSRDLHIYPNPIQQTTTIEFYNTQKGDVNVSVFDIAGRKLVQSSSILSQGNCVYKLSGLSMGTFIVNISTNSTRLAAIVLSKVETSQQPTIELLDVKEQANAIKSVSLIDANFETRTAEQEDISASNKSVANIVEMQYNEGENLKFTAYLETITSEQEDIPTSNKMITFFYSTTGADNPYMMPYYTGEILPTPQNVEYKDEYLSLANTAIILNNAEQNDSRLKYLLERIIRYGGEYEFVTEATEEHTCVIKINDNALTPPTNPQGYIINSIDNTISLKGTDFQGLLWAISSLNQMIFDNNGESVIRLLDVIDWPDSELRGMLPEQSYDIKQLAHLMVAFKLNMVDFRATISKDGEHEVDWRLPRSAVFHEKLNEIEVRLTPLQFEWYAGARFLGYDQVPQINCSSEADFDIIYNNFAVPIAEAGGNLSVQFDDLRFPLHTDDTTNFGTAANADHYLLTELYDNLISDYPDIKIAFCPPFYWGPDGPEPYPEPRDVYLNKMGTLPDAIEIYWTGPRVRSETVVQADVQWEFDRINRKPFVFQNGLGIPHVFDFHYMTDPVYSLNEWYYEDYLIDIKAYGINGADIAYSGALVSVADWTWNQEEFDPETTIEEAVMKLTGPEAYPILINMNIELSKFDTYLPDITFRAVRDLDMLNDALDNLETLNTNLSALSNGESIDFWTAVESSHLSTVRHFVEQVNQASEDPIVQQIIDRPDASVAMYFAVSDGVFDPNSDDIFIKPADFNGCAVINYGYYNADPLMHLEDRPTAIITGQGTPISEMTANFDINPFPPSNDYQLIITGADDFLPDNCPIAITLNDEVIFEEGPNPFDNTEWNTQLFDIPASLLLETDNVLTIYNTYNPGNYDAPPAFMVNYVILREIP